jgi:peroxiredoxin
MMQSKIKAWLRAWLPYVAVMVLLFWGVNAWRARDVPNLAPDWQASTVNGDATSLTQIRALYPNQTIALIFWAEWCPICRTEEGSISNLTQDKTLAFIPIATQSGNAQNVRRIFKERGLNWNAVVDESGEIFRSYQLVGVPAFIVINPDGTVRNVQTGYTSEAGMRLRMR